MDSPHDRKRQKTSGVSDASLRSSAEVRSWMSAMGVELHPGVDMCQSEAEQGYGYFLRANRELAKGVEVMSVPRQAMITSEVVAQVRASRRRMGRQTSPPTHTHTSINHHGALPPPPPFSNPTHPFSSPISFFPKSDVGVAMCGVVESGEGDEKGGFVDHVSDLDDQHERLSTMGGGDLLEQIMAERARAADPVPDPKLDSSVVVDPSNPAAKGESVPTDRGVLLAYLIHQRYGEEQPPPSSPPSPPSSWSHAPFVRCFPNAYGLPISWSRAELEMLSSNILCHKVLLSTAAVTAQLAADYHAVRRVATRASREAVVSALTWERWLWASASVSSRSHGDTVAMGATKGPDAMGVIVPVLDMLNHDPESAQITWKRRKVRIMAETSGGGGGDGGVDKAGGGREGGGGDAKREEGDGDDDAGADGAGAAGAGGGRAVLERPLACGDQVLTHYGHDRSNAELLLSYGFAQWDNGHDELTVGWGLDDAPTVLAAAKGKSGAEVARCRRFALLASTALGGDMVALQTAMSLLQGGKLELTLSHATPMGTPGRGDLLSLFLIDLVPIEDESPIHDPEVGRGLGKGERESAPVYHRSSAVPTPLEHLLSTT